MSYNYFASVLPLSYYNIRCFIEEARKCAIEKTRNPRVLVSKVNVSKLCYKNKIFPYVLKLSRILFTTSHSWVYIYTKQGLKANLFSFFIVYKIQGHKIQVKNTHKYINTLVLLC